MDRPVSGERVQTTSSQWKEGISIYHTSSMTLVCPKPLLADILEGVKGVPPQFVRPVSDRPNLRAVLPPEEGSIPVVDLGGIDGPHRSKVVDDIGVACQDYGFFQVKNHGVPEDLAKRMLDTGKAFFELPESKRMESYSDDPMKTTRLSTSFNIRTEKTRSWRDYLRLHCHPLEDFVHEWPSYPPTLREVVGEYSTKVRELALKLLGAISESLGLERDHMEKAMGKQTQHMAINHYPPCPDPELTYGLPGHMDPNAITLLLLDDVPGLQVLRNGRWVAVDPFPNTFIVNVGDQIQALTNGRYKSVLHRAVVNGSRGRLSVPTFYGPSMDAVIEPSAALVDEANPAAYRAFTYEEYYAKFWNRGLYKESCLDLFKRRH